MSRCTRFPASTILATDVGGLFTSATCRVLLAMCPSDMRTLSFLSTCFADARSASSTKIRCLPQTSGLRSVSLDCRCLPAQRSLLLPSPPQLRDPPTCTVLRSPISTLKMKSSLPAALWRPHSQSTPHTPPSSEDSSSECLPPRQQLAWRVCSGTGPKTPTERRQRVSRAGNGQGMGRVARLSSRPKTL